MNVTVSQSGNRLTSNINFVKIYGVVYLWFLQFYIFAYVLTFYVKCCPPPQMSRIPVEAANSSLKEKNFRNKE